MSALNLDSCPWCGSDEHLYVSKCGSLTGDMPDRPYRVVCDHIDHDQVQGPVAYGKQAAITAWNTRISHSLPGDVGTALAKVVHENGPVVVDQMGEDLAWRPLDYGTWTPFEAAPSPCPGDGMRLVPVEPTEAMYLAAFDSDHWGGKQPIRRVVDEIWSAMLRAALTASSLSEEIGEGNRDCLAKRLPGEPMFIILGRDPDGANIVRLWAERRIAAGDAEHGESVLKIADEMDAWEGKPKSAPDASAYPAIPSAVSGDAGEGESQITLSEYELRNIDELISVHAILGGDHYDTLWNLRNRIKPFVEGDEHFDPEFPLAGEGE